MKINPSKMTTDEIRDWLARSSGWGLPGDKGLLSDGTSVTLTKYHKKSNGQMLMQSEHPFPPTLDAAAAAMPERWSWRRSDDGWIGGKVGGARNTLWRMVSIPDTGNEIDDRYKLAALCILAEENASGQH